jgi:anti-sigma B factor antagonist
MQIKSSNAGEAVVLHLDGRLNMVAAPQVRGAINDLVQSGDSRIVVDLGKTEFMDSSGLGALIAALRSARQAGGDLRIANAGEQVVTVLQLTNLGRVLRPHDTVEDALDGW